MKIELLATLLAMTSANQTEMQALQSVQNRVNTKIEYRWEPDNQDVWSIPKKRGDCEDFALLKRQVLIEEHGFAPEDLSILLVVQKSKYQGHALLYSHKHKVVLDNPFRPLENPVVESYDKYMARTGSSLYCVFQDISTGKKYKNVSERCGPVKIKTL